MDHSTQATNGKAVFHVHGISKVYHVGDVDVHALRGIYLDLYRGEFVVLLGPSGSGKSTLLNILSGLDVPTIGEVYYQRSADEAVEHARADHEQAERDLRRAENLVESSVISRQSLEEAKRAESIARNELEASRFKAQAAASEVDVAKAGLIAIESEQR